MAWNGAACVLMSARPPCIDQRPKPYCKCSSHFTPMPDKALSTCRCGENDKAKEWKWERPNNKSSWVVVMSEDQKTVTFNHCDSSGTAAVKGEMPMVPNYHYYWEVKMLTDARGTDIVVGMCSNMANFKYFQHEYKSLIGQDSESYGLSYKGVVRHRGKYCKDTKGFCRGALVGIRLDMWEGTMEFYINRKPQGISFYNLRRHKELYPVLSSSIAHSTFRLTYAVSWKASLQQEALKALNASAASSFAQLAIPGSLRRALEMQPWLNGGDDNQRNHHHVIYSPVVAPQRLFPRSVQKDDSDFEELSTNCEKRSQRARALRLSRKILQNSLLTAARPLLDSPGALLDSPATRRPRPD